MKQYAWWTNALEIGGGRQLSREQQQALGITTEPQAGFYRKRNKGGQDVPVAIWHTPGGMVATAGDDTVDPNDIWTWCCQWPVSEQAERDVAENGKDWPDDDPVVVAQVASAIGHNSAAVDEAEALRDQIDAAKKGADAYKVITDDETLAKAQGLRSRLLELSGEAVKKHKKAKEPHLEAGRVEDKKWFPMRDDAKDAADAIRSAMSAYETAKLHRQREAERKAEAERRAEEASKASEQPATAESAPPASQPVAAAPTPIRGSYGRAASVSVVNVVTAITDQKALYEFLKDHPDLKNCMFDLASRAVAKGHAVPGVAIEEQAKVA